MKWRNPFDEAISRMIHSSNPFKPNFSQKGRIVHVGSHLNRLSQSLQNTHWRRQWLPHLTRISSHRTKFLSLGTERNHTERNPENRVNEESIHSPIRSFVIATVDLWDGALSWWKSTFLRANLADLSRCRVIKWIVAPFHGNLPNLSNDPRIKCVCVYIYMYTFRSKLIKIQFNTDFLKNSGNCVLLIQRSKL